MPELKSILKTCEGIDRLKFLAKSSELLTSSGIAMC